MTVIVIDYVLNVVFIVVARGVNALQTLGRLSFPSHPPFPPRLIELGGGEHCKLSQHSPATKCVLVYF